MSSFCVLLNCSQPTKPTKSNCNTNVTNPSHFTPLQQQQPPPPLPHHHHYHHHRYRTAIECLNSHMTPGQPKVQYCAVDFTSLSKEKHLNVLQVLKDVAAWTTAQVSVTGVVVVGANPVTVTSSMWRQHPVMITTTTTTSSSSSSSNACRSHHHHHYPHDTTITLRGLQPSPSRPVSSAPDPRTELIR